MNVLRSQINLTQAGESLALAVEELTRSIEAGQRIDVEAFTALYPQHEAPLRKLLPAIEALARLAHSGGSVLSPDPLGESIDEMGRLGDYRILREVGRGGMGVVYEAEQISLSRRVALKILPFAAVLDPRHLQRFKNEAMAAAHLDHPNIVEVYGIGCERSIHFYAMRFIEGVTLADVVETKRRSRARNVEGRNLSVELCPNDECRTEVFSHSSDSSLCTSHAPLAAETSPVLQAALSTVNSITPKERYRRIAEIGIQAAEALDHAHQMGIVHRDIKPSNLMLDERGKLWVADFGLARSTGEASMTMTGDLVGTLRYMSPEQALAKRITVDHRTDIYSLGATLYELLALRAAFPSNDREETLRQIAFEEPTAPRKLDKSIPEELEAIVLKAMEKNPVERYATARALTDDLRRWLEHKPIEAKAPGLVLKARKWTRRHRSVAWGTGATLAIGGLVLAATAGWIVNDRSARQLIAEATARPALDEAMQLVEESKWLEAAANVRRAEDVLANAGVRGALADGAHELRKDIEMAQRLESLRRGSAYAGKFVNYFTPSGVVTQDAEYGASLALAFRDYGIDIDTLGPVEAADRVHGRRIQSELIQALDSWAGWGKKMNAPDWKRPRDVAQRADSDPLRKRLRDVLELEGGDLKSALIALAASPESQEADTDTAFRLAYWLQTVDAADAAIEILRTAQLRHPGDFDVNFQLAKCLHRASVPDLDGAVRFYSAAIAIQPENSSAHNNLGHVLADKGMRDESLTQFREAVRIEPKNSIAHANLGVAQKERGLLEESIASLRMAVQLSPDDYQARACLGYTLEQAGARDEAIASFREAIRVKPDYSDALSGLGVSLAIQGRLNEAIECFQECIRLNPDDEQSALNLGVAAWTLATSPADEVRDGRRAVELATKACDVTGYKNSNLLDTLAAAFAETGDFESASQFAQKALDLATEDADSQEAAAHLETFKNRRPWRDTQMHPGADTPMQ